MTITKHAEQRSQQRSIPLNEFDLIMQIGTPDFCPGGATSFTVLRKDKTHAIEYLKKLIQKVDKLEGKTIVTSGDSIITTYHKKDKK